MRQIHADRTAAFTLVDLLVTASLFRLATVMVVRAKADAVQARRERIACVNNLRQLGLAFRLWSNDHNDNFPMANGAEKGGSRDGIEKEEPWRHFKALSNELAGPKLLTCPADDRQPAIDFAKLTVTNLSYFVGIDAEESLPNMPLSGDRTVTDGISPTKGIIELTDMPPSGWTETIHQDAGNILFSSGGVDQANNWLLRRRISAANDSNGLSKVRLQLP